MHRVAKIAVLCCLAFVGWGYQPAAAGCQVISATHSAPNRLAALQMSQALAVENANNLRRANGWSYASMRPYRVRPNPFWKSVRPVVPERVILKPDVVTARTYTICFTGVFAHRVQPSAGISGGLPPRCRRLVRFVPEAE